MESLLNRKPSLLPIYSKNTSKIKKLYSRYINRCEYCNRPKTYGSKKYCKRHFDLIFHLNLLKQGYSNEVINIFQNILIEDELNKENKLIHAVFFNNKFNTRSVNNNNEVDNDNDSEIDNNNEVDNEVDNKLNSNSNIKTIYINDESIHTDIKVEQCNAPVKYNQLRSNMIVLTIDNESDNEMIDIDDEFLYEGLDKLIKAEK